MRLIMHISHKPIKAPIMFVRPDGFLPAIGCYGFLFWESCPDWLLLPAVEMPASCLVSLLVFCSGISSGISRLSSMMVAASAPAFSSSNCLYFRRLFLAALSAFFFFIAPTTAERLWSPLMCSSTRCARISRASLRFWLRDRVAWDLTTMPVGMCLSWTAELVLF